MLGVVGNALYAGGTAGGEDRMANWGELHTDITDNH